MYIDSDRLKDRDSLVLGASADEPETDGRFVVTAGVRPCSDVAVMRECPYRIDGVEVWCHRGPSCIKGINKVKPARDCVMSVRSDMLPEDPDLAALNWALLAGSRDIRLAGFRPPRDQAEDTAVGRWLEAVFPDACISCDDNSWSAFENVREVETECEFESPLGDLGAVCDLQSVAAIVACYRSGGDFDGWAREYVERLYLGCRQHISRKLQWKFYVVTDCPGQFADMPVIPVTMASDLEKWHCKFEIFRTELWEGHSTVICMDLDTAVVGDINNVLTANIEFGLLSDIYKPERPASGMIVYRPDPKYRRLYERVLERRPDRKTWDIYPLLEGLEEIGVSPERLQDRFAIHSWKKDLHNRDGRMLDLPADSQIVVWHGRPRPHSCNWEIPAKAQSPEVEWIEIRPTRPRRTMYLVGGGPSLRKNSPDDYLNRSDLVLGVNDAYAYDCVSSILFSDGGWWRVHRESLEAWDGKIWTTAAIPHPGLRHIRKRKAWLSTDPSWIAWNASTGWSALNIALLAGADRIVLLGYDMGRAADGSTNWHRNIRRLKSTAFEVFLNRENGIADAVEEMYPDVEIVVSEPTNLSRWPTMPMADAVAWGRSERPNSGITGHREDMP